MKPITEQFLDFVQSKPADEEYDFHDIYECPCGQFAVATGYVKEGAPFGASDDVMDLHVGIASHLIAKPHTFGALAARLVEARGQ